MLLDSRFSFTYNSHGEQELLSLSLISSGKFDLMHWLSSLSLCVLHLTKKLECFVLYLKIINTSLQWRSHGLPGWAHPERQNKDNNEESLRENKKKWWKFEKKLGK